MLRLFRDADDFPSCSIASILTAIHDRWLQRLRQLVAASLAPEADRAERRAALHNLDDQLGRWQVGERALVRTLGPVLPLDAAQRLARAEAAIQHLRNELGWVDGQPESAFPIREVVLDVLDALQLWCAELELAATGLAFSQLDDESRATLTQLSQPNEP